MQRPLRRRRKAKQDLLGYALLVLALLIAVGLFAFSTVLRRNRPTLDQTTMCPDDGPRGLTVLLVDTTDSLTPVQNADLRNQLQRLKEAVPEYCAVDVYMVAAVERDLLRPIGGRICNPGNGSNASPFIRNPRLMRDRWAKRFSQPLDDLFTEMLNTPQAEQSPIFESIQSAAVTAFGRLSDGVKNRNLIIVSDMLHNTAEYSHYRAIPDFNDFRSTTYYRRVRPDLRGVDVELYYLRRDQTPQGKNHIEFWQQYFADSGAKLVHVIALQG